jgi:energy-converting hydrogenase B subunit D
MTFWALDYLIVGLLLAAAVLVVRLRNLNGAVMALSAVGTMLSLLFIVLGAPDVAHSEVVVGAIAVPVLYLVVIGKSRAEVADQRELGERGQGREDRRREPR